MTAYMIVIAIISVSFIYKNLNDAWNAGNLLAGVGIAILFISLVGVINRKDIIELSHYFWKFTKRKLKSK